MKLYVTKYREMTRGEYFLIVIIAGVAMVGAWLVSGAVRFAS